MQRDSPGSGQVNYFRCAATDASSNRWRAVDDGCRKDNDFTPRPGSIEFPSDANHPLTISKKKAHLLYNTKAKDAEKKEALLNGQSPDA